MSTYTYCVLGTVLYMHGLTESSKQPHEPHLGAGETLAQRGEVAWPRSHS